MAITPGYVAAGNGQVPDVPLIGTLSVASNTSLTASWQAPASGKHTPLTYVVSVYDTNGNLVSTSSASVAASNVTATVSGLSPSTAYKVKVKLLTSFLESSTSAFSNSAITYAPPPPPPPPPVDPPPGGGGGGTVSPGCDTYTTTYQSTQYNELCASTQNYVTWASSVCGADYDYIISVGGCVPADPGGGSPTCPSTCPAITPPWPTTCPPGDTQRRTRPSCVNADCTVTPASTSSRTCPPKTCTPYTNTGNYGACQNIKYIGGKQYCGTKYRNVSWRNSDCSTGTYTQSASCCVTVG